MSMVTSMLLMIGEWYKWCEERVTVLILMNEPRNQIVCSIILLLFHPTRTNHSVLLSLLLPKCMSHTLRSHNPPPQEINITQSSRYFYHHLPLAVWSCSTVRHFFAMLLYPLVSPHFELVYVLVQPAAPLPLLYDGDDEYIHSCYE